MKEVASITSGYGPTSIDDLPLEVLSEVAAHLDFLDILSLQQTSRKLRESTEARDVWLALTKEYSARHFNLYHPGPLDDIKTVELRAWIRKRLVVDQIWREPRAAPRIRTLEQADMQCNFWEIVFKLVPGGRWLLALYIDGSVWYYDLKSEVSERLPLVSPTELSEGPTENVGKLAVFVNQDASGGEFKLVVYRTEAETDGGKCGWLDIWQVELEDANFLVADRLTSILCGHGYIEAFAFDPQLVACAMYRPMNRSHWIEVIWWEQHSVTTDRRVRFSKRGDMTENIHLIGDDRILCLSAYGETNIYTLPEPECTNGFRQDEPPSREPIWSYSFGYGTIYTSPICYDGAAYRLVVSAIDGIQVLVVPASNDNNPSIIKLSKISNEEGICIPGICKAYAEGYDKGGTGVRIGYSLDERNGAPAIDYFNEGRKVVVGLANSPILDEEGGRVVYISRMNCNIMVVDFLHQFNETL